MASRKPILFLVSGLSSYKLLRLLAEHCVGAGRSVHFWYDGSDSAIFDGIKADGDVLGFCVERLDADPAPASPHGASSGRSAVSRRLSLESFLADEARVSRALSRVMPQSRARSFAHRAAARTALPGLPLYRRQLAARLAHASAGLERLDPAVLVVSEDGISGSMPVLAAARRARIPLIDVPYGFGVRRDLEIDLDNKEARGERILLDESTRGARLLKRLAPQWVKAGAHAGALMYPVDYVLAAESLGMSVRDPWIIHGGSSDILCAESAQMEGVYLSEGVPKGKIRRTGSPYCDAIARAVAKIPAAREALRTARRITEGRTRILVSWPPSYHDVRGRFSEFPTYTEMTRHFFTWLRTLPDCDLTVSLHPAVSAVGRQAIEEAGLAPDERYVIDLIAQHDIFVTYFSSTIRWAIACGKPVVNYDAYRLSLDVYDSAPGFVNAADFAQFQEALSRLVCVPGAFEALASRQSAVGEMWGTLDGRCNERILAELDDLVRSRR